MAGGGGRSPLLCAFQTVAPGGTTRHGLACCHQRQHRKCSLCFSPKYAAIPTSRPPNKPVAGSSPANSPGLQVWDRVANNWTNVYTGINSICGGWTKQPNGHVGLLAGHYKSLGGAQKFSMNRIVAFDTTRQVAVPM